MEEHIKKNKTSPLSNNISDDIKESYKGKFLSNSDDISEIDIPDELGEFDKEELYTNEAILLVCGIPDDKNDNDPILIERMQSIYEIFFIEHKQKALVAGKGIIEKLKGRNFTEQEIVRMEIDCIDEQVHTLTHVNLMALTANIQIRIRRYMAFLETLKINLNKDIGIKPFRGTLEKACIGSDQYELIKSWFINNGLCDPVTFIWKDNKKGNKSILINYLKDLHIKGYTEQLAHSEIKSIAKNSFGVNVGIDMVKTAKLKGKSEIPSFKR